MGVHYGEHEFPKSFGFTGSAGKNPVKAHMRSGKSVEQAYAKGGHVNKKVAGLYHGDGADGHKHMHHIIAKVKAKAHPEMRHVHGHHEGHMVLKKKAGGSVKQCYAEGGTAEKDFLQEKKHEVLEKDEKQMPEYKYRKDSGDKALEKKRGGKVSANSTFDEKEDRKTAERFAKPDMRVAQDDGQSGLDGSTNAKRNWTDFKSGGDVKVPGSRSEDTSPMKLDKRMVREERGENAKNDAKAGKESHHETGVKKYAFGGMGRNPRANAAIHAKTKKPGGGRGLGALGMAPGPALGGMGAPAGGGGPPPPPAFGAPPPGSPMGAPPMKRGGHAR